jgi:molybdenum-dependent DNA-binding transcriptional regulator ModE
MDATGYTMQLPRRIRSDDWLEQDGEVVLRESCMMLLEVVELTGSISVATTYP